MLRRGSAAHPASVALRRAQVRALALVGDLKGARAVVDSFAAVWSTTLTVSPANFHEDIIEELIAHGKAGDAQPFIDAALKWFAERPPEELETRSGRRFAIARLLRHAGKLDSALKILDTVVRRDTTFAFGSAALYSAEIAALAGDTTALVTARAWLLQRVGVPYTYGAPSAALAQVAAILGQKDEAVRLLNAALSQGTPFVIDIHRDRALENIRDYEPFKQFLRPRG